MIESCSASLKKTSSTKHDFETKSFERTLTVIAGRKTKLSDFLCSRFLAKRDRRLTFSC